MLKDGVALLACANIETESQLMQKTQGQACK